MPSEKMESRRKRISATARAIKRHPVVGLSASTPRKAIPKREPESPAEATLRSRKRRKSFGGYLKMLATGRPD